MKFIKNSNPQMCQNLLQNELSHAKIKGYKLGTKDLKLDKIQDVSKAVLGLNMFLC